MTPRLLTDNEEAQFKTKYPAIWRRAIGGIRLLDQNPHTKQITLEVFVYDPNATCAVPVNVKGFQLELDKDPCPPSP